MDDRSPDLSSDFAVIAIGASAGGVEALLALVPALPSDLPAAVLVVQHLDPRHQSLLPWLLRRASMTVITAAHGDKIAPGTVYIAPPDMHLLVANGCIELSHSKLVHFTRPSVDLLFESVAGAYGPRAVGVILTGTGVDGATGMTAIKRMGGRTIVEDPSGAAHGGMPRAAVATGSVDQVLSLERIGDALVSLVTTAGGPERSR
jgi:two-component system chemotaxis response regulator CheB